MSSYSFLQTVNVEVLSPTDGYYRANNYICNCRKRRFSTTFTNGKLGNSIEVICLIDSGSCNTLINQDTWREICKTDSLSTNVYDSGLKFKSSNGNSLSCLGWAEIRVTIGRTSVIHPAYIIEGDCHSFIIGCDLLINIEAIIDYSDEILCIGNHQYPLFSAIVHSKPHKDTVEIYQISVTKIQMFSDTFFFILN
ncbi:hypothetical protein HZS_8057 [Henneguya salminicola]|nr:hypothetical protein HZS_8057 [Henneguya salminicola]